MTIFVCSLLLLQVLHHLVRLLVRYHALVGALHLVKEDNIDVGLGALAEACGDHETIEKVIVVGDALVLVRRGRREERSPETCVGRCL